MACHPFSLVLKDSSNVHGALTGPSHRGSIMGTVKKRKTLFVHSVSLANNHKPTQFFHATNHARTGFSHTRRPNTNARRRRTDRSAASLRSVFFGSIRYQP